MSHRIHNLDDEIMNTVNQDALERLRAHHRDAARDLVIAALNRALGDDFTYGPWEDLSYHEATPESVAPMAINPNHNERCELVSPTRKFTLYTGDMYDDLHGLNDQGVFTHYDVSELLDSDKLIEEVRETLAFGCV